MNEKWEAWHTVFSPASVESPKQGHGLLHAEPGMKTPEFAPTAPGKVSVNPMNEYPAEFYDALHRGTPGDLEHYQSHCAQSSKLLELGCGSGRVLTALSAPSRSCTGVDIHPGLLKLAHERLTAAPNTQLLAQDMLTLSLNAEFDRILLPFCGLYCIETPEELDRLFRGVAAHLSPEGRFILDTYNADLFHQDDDEPDQEQVPHEHGEIQVRGVTYQVFEQSRWDRTSQQILVSYLHAATDADAARDAGLADEVVAELLHRYWLSEQVEESARQAGLTRDLAFGDFQGSPWAPDSPWNIFHYRLGD